MTIIVVKIGLGDFKARCLALIDELHREGGQIILTKRGKEVAQILPILHSQNQMTNPLAGVVMRADWR